MSDLHIALFAENGRGHLENLGESYEPSDFGGIVPVIGDTICGPGVLQGLDRTKPENRTLYVVQQRYLIPSQGEKFPPLVGLVVEPRMGELREANLLGP